MQGVYSQDDFIESVKHSLDLVVHNEHQFNIIRENKFYENTKLFDYCRCDYCRMLWLSIFYRAKNKYNMDVFGIKDGTAGLMQRPVATIKLTHKTFEGYLLRQGGTFLGSTNKGNPFKFPTSEGKFIDRSKEIIERLAYDRRRNRKS